MAVAAAGVISGSLMCSAQAKDVDSLGRSQSGGSSSSQRGGFGAQDKKKLGGSETVIPLALSALLLVAALLSAEDGLRLSSYMEVQRGAMLLAALGLILQATLPHQGLWSSSKSSSKKKPASPPLLFEVRKPKSHQSEVIVVSVLG